MSIGFLKKIRKNEKKFSRGIYSIENQTITTAEILRYGILPLSSSSKAKDLRENASAQG